MKVHRNKYFAFAAGMPRRGCAVAVLLAGLSWVPASAVAMPFVASPLMIDLDGRLSPIDARSYRHCHNIHTRTYCHKADKLPVNWPPHTDTPARREERTGRTWKWRVPMK